MQQASSSDGIYVLLKSHFKSVFITCFYRLVIPLFLYLAFLKSLFVITYTFCILFDSLRHFSLPLVPHIDIDPCCTWFYHLAFFLYELSFHFVHL